MRRTLFLSAFVCLVAGAATAGEVKIAWHGQSMFEIITPKGTRIVLDPHNLDAFRVKPLKADLVLMSHFHTDHTRVEMIENLKDAKQLNALKKTGPGGAVIEWNTVDEKFKDVRLQTVGTFHDNASGLTRGKNGVWIIDVDGLRIVHLGDLGHLLNKAQLKKLGTVDVLMIPVGGVYTINAIDAYKVCEQIKPRRFIVPMHYGTPVYTDLLPLTYFRDECKENEVPLVTYKAGEWLTVDSKTPLPKKASAAELSYLGGTPLIKPKKKDKGKDK